MSVDARPDDEKIDVGALMAALLSRWLRIVIVTAGCLAVTFGILIFVPKLYESTAAVLVEQRGNAPTLPTVQGSSQPPIPVEAMMSSQIELIRSRDTLISVIDRENLRSQPEFTGLGFSPLTLFMQLIGRGPEPRSIDETVMENLVERLTVARQRDSAVISISVRSEDPELAARLANAIAEAHVSRRTALTLSDTAEASEWLEQEIARLRVKAAEADAAVANYRVDNDLFTGSDNTSILNQQLTAISSQITAAQERKNAAQSRANLIRELIASGQPIDGVQDVRNSVVIQQLSQTKANLQGELAQRSSTLLPNHPTIKALVAQVDEIEDQITAEARRVADALEAEGRIEANLESSLRDDLARAKLTVSTATRDGVTLEGLMREAKAQRDLLDSYLLRYSDATSRTDAGSALPDVRQITVAVPSTVPASPKTTLILGAVAFVVLTLQVGGVLFGELMSGRAIRDGNTFRRVDEEAEEPPVVADLFDPSVREKVAPVAPPEIEERADSELVAGVPEPPPPSGEPAETLPSSAVAAVALPTLGDEPRDASAPESSAAASTTVPGSTAVPADVPDRVPATDKGRPTPQASAAENAVELSNLSADIAIGRVRIVMLAALEDNKDCELVAETLISDALRRGLSVVKIDAGSGRTSVEPGLSDLTADRVSFGDVVHRVREGLAEVPWGHLATIERRSMRPITLIEALSDIYEVVLVTTGRIGMTSALPIFAGVPCRLVLVGGGRPDRAAVSRAIDDAANLGYEVGQFVQPLARQTEVA